MSLWIKTLILILHNIGLLVLVKSVEVEYWTQCFISNSLHLQVFGHTKGTQWHTKNTQTQHRKNTDPARRPCVL